MRARRQPADPADLVKDFLKAQLSGVATADLVLDGDWTPDKLPAVVVFDDGGGSEFPVSTSPLLRITVWAEDRPTAREVAGRCAGLVYAGKPAGIAHVGVPSTILDARDEHNDGLMAGFTVRVKARTLPL